MSKSISGTSAMPEGDPVWDEDEEEVILPGGRPAAEAVAEIVRELGYETDDLEADVEHYSWTFDARGHGRAYFVNVFHMDEELHVLFGWPSTGCLWFGPGPKDGGPLPELLFERMAADPRFSDIVLE